MSGECDVHGEHESGACHECEWEELMESRAEWKDEAIKATAALIAVEGRASRLKEALHELLAAHLRVDPHPPEDCSNCRLAQRALDDISATNKRPPGDTLNCKHGILGNFCLPCLNEALAAQTKALEEVRRERDVARELAEGLQIPGPLGKVWGSMEWHVCERSEQNAKDAIYFSDLAKRQHEHLKTVKADLQAARERIRVLEEAMRDAAEQLRKPKHPHSRAESALGILDAALTPTAPEAPKVTVLECSDTLSTTMVDLLCRKPHGHDGDHSSGTRDWPNHAPDPRDGEGG